MDKRDAASDDERDSGDDVDEGEEEFSDVESSEEEEVVAEREAASGEEEEEQARGVGWRGLGVVMNQTSRQVHLGAASYCNSSLAIPCVARLLGGAIA